MVLSGHSHECRGRTLLPLPLTPYSREIKLGTAFLAMASLGGVIAPSKEMVTLGRLVQDWALLPGHPHLRPQHPLIHKGNQRTSKLVFLQNKKNVLQNYFLPVSAHEAACNIFFLQEGGRVEDKCNLRSETPVPQPSALSCPAM